MMACVDATDDLGVRLFSGRLCAEREVHILGIDGVEVGLYLRQH